MNSFRPISLVAAAIFLGSTAAAQSSRTQGSGAAREMETARAVYREVTRDSAAGVLARRDSVVRCAADDLPLQVTFWTDADGHVRELVWSGGSEDHAETSRYYYDGLARLRFSFTTRGAVNGTRQEERVYYAADGRVLSRRVQRTQGLGYPFADARPIRDPALWLRRLCPDAGG
jgi:hypothetical protein